MAAHRLTSKGQVTIPKSMRDAIGLRPGDAVDFERDGACILITRSPYESAKDHPLIKRLQGHGTKLGMSTEEYMKLIRVDD